MNIKEEVVEANENMLFSNGLDRAIIGYVEGPGQLPVALYDRDLVLAVMMEDDSMTEEEALEHFEYNVLGAYMGENSPMYATLVTKEDTYEKPTKKD